MAGKDKNPKMATHSAPSPPMSASHAPAPKRKGADKAPAAASAKRIKAAWRKNSRGLSLRQYAKNHGDQAGEDWLKNKRASG